MPACARILRDWVLADSPAKRRERLKVSEGFSPKNSP
jgi:hypothetical protein